MKISNFHDVIEDITLMVFIVCVLVSSIRFITLGDVALGTCDLVSFILIFLFIIGDEE